MAIGANQPGDGGMRLTVCDPARGTVVAELAVDDGAAVAAAVARGRAAQPAWAALSPRERTRRLKRARRELVRDRAAILDRLERETGKARFDVVGELMGVCIDLGWLARRAPRWLAPLRVSTRPLLGKRGRVVFKPRGVIGIISPWNAPLNLALGDAIPALLAGNAVVIKPSELAPLAIARAVETMNRVLPSGGDRRRARRSRRHGVRHRLAGDRTARDGAREPPADAGAARAGRQGSDDRPR